MRKISDYLIHEWQHAWKLWSVQLNVIGIGLMAFGEIMRDSWSALPPSLADRIPHAETIGLIVFILGLVARLMKQKPSK